MIDNRIGQQFGNYRLIRFLGQGGFADVYLGQHIHLGTQAAIKVLHAQLASDDINEFRTEARTIAHLEHANIVRVLEFGVEGNMPFLVMEHAPHGTLRQHHQKGSRLPLELVVSYVRQIASALQYAHEQRLIHRDIKPENMLLRRAHEVLLSDFGLALFAQSTNSQTTKRPEGTMAYMAPEQIQGKPRPASDQYALGIVVYEWLSGERPFQGMNNEIMGQHLFAPPPPLSGRILGVSPTVERVVSTALAKEPQQRFPTVQAFATALEQAVLHGSSSSSLMNAPLNQPLHSADPIRPPQPQHSSLWGYVQPTSPSTPPYQPSPSGALPRDYPPHLASTPPTVSSSLPQYPISTSTPPYQPPPPMEIPPVWGNYSGPSASQQGNSAIPPPPFGFTMQNPGNNINTPGSGKVSGQIFPQMPSSPPGKEKKKKSKTGLMFIVIMLVVILIAISSAGATYFFASKQPSSLGSGTQIQPTTTSLQTGTPTNTLTPTLTSPTSLPTASLSNPQLPLKIPCVNCPYPQLSVTLNRIDVDSPGLSTHWVFSFLNSGSISCSNLSFYPIRLTDSVGTSYNGQGQVESSFAISAGQSVQVISVFNVIPTSSKQYTLKMVVSLGGCNSSSGYDNTYQTENFQFA